jgi:signal peptidase I
MQCFNCHFENMPGITVCGRCGTSLGVATAVIDVHPPRARSWSKRLRRLVPVRRAAIRLRDVTASASSRVQAAALEVGMPETPAPLIERMIVPGWAHFYLGQRVRGWIFMGLYAALVPLALVFWGTTPGSILLGLVFSVHASSVVDVLFQCPGQIGSRLLITGIVMAALGLGLYFPAGWVLNRLADTRTISRNVAPFEADDVVLVNRFAYLRSLPQPGDVVLVRIPADNGAGIRLQEGEFIDRILAGPGDRVKVQAGQIMINDSPSTHEPLNVNNVTSRLAALQLTVPPDSYFILPTTMGYVNERLATSQLWHSLSLVPHDRIVGKVYMRHQPMPRLWLIR